jgi:hypothetical protein
MMMVMLINNHRDDDDSDDSLCNTNRSTYLSTPDIFLSHRKTQSVMQMTDRSIELIRVKQ